MSTAKVREKCMKQVDHRWNWINCSNDSRKLTVSKVINDWTLNANMHWGPCPAQFCIWFEQNWQMNQPNRSSKLSLQCRFSLPFSSFQNSGNHSKSVCEAIVQMDDSIWYGWPSAWFDLNTEFDVGCLASICMDIYIHKSNETAGRGGSIISSICFDV